LLSPRIIPCLLLHEEGLVKTKNFKDPKYIGDPLNAVKIFNEKEADELIVLDIDASKLKSEPNFKLIKQLAGECRMPLCYGGGIRSLEQAKKIIRLGVEKVAFSSIAIEDPKIVTHIANSIGSQSVVVILDVKKNFFGKYEVWINNATKNSKKNILDIIKEYEKLGAGEIVINSIDQDGNMNGYDLSLARIVQKSINIPSTFLGGAGSLDDIANLINTCGIVGAAAGSFFVFKGIYRAVLISYPSRKQKEILIKTKD
jgi:cyclase